MHHRDVEKIILDDAREIQVFQRIPFHHAKHIALEKMRAKDPRLVNWWLTSPSGEELFPDMPAY